MQINRPIATAIIIFITAVFVFLAVMPEYKIFKDLRQKLGEEKAEYNAKFDYFSAIAKAYNDLQGRPADLKKIDDALPEDPNMGPLVYFFQRKAMENGIMLSNLFLSKSSLVDTEGSLKEVVFSINLKGNYFALENFIASLQKSSRIFEVTNVSFNYGDQSQPATSTSSSPAASVLSRLNAAYLFNLEVKTYSY